MVLTKIPTLNKILILLILPCFVAGQRDTTKRALTKFESFSSETGVLYERQPTQLGKIKEATLSKIVITNIETKKSATSLVITFKTQGLFGLSSPTGYLIFDPEEIAGLIKTLDFVKTNVITNKCKEDCPTYSYESNGGVEMYVTKNIGPYGNAWHILFTRYGITGTGGEIDDERIDQFISLLQKF
jgi:hypothetical protein